MTRPITSRSGASRGFAVQDSPPRDAAFVPAPFLADGSFGRVAATYGSEVVVECPNEERRQVPPHGFGLWQFLVGDEVAIGKDVDGTWKAFPAVTTIVTQPVTDVVAGEFINLDGHAVRVVDTAVVDRLSMLSTMHPAEELHYLAVRNLDTSELRLWGVFNNQRRSAVAEVSATSGPR